MTQSDINRRHFDRLSLTEEAIAVDQSGREIGRIMQASGGGMLVKADSLAIAESVSSGQILRVTVMEPGTQTAHTIDVEVRHRERDLIGVEFITGVTSPSTPKG